MDTDSPQLHRIMNSISYVATKENYLISRYSRCQNAASMAHLCEEVMKDLSMIVGFSEEDLQPAIVLSTDIIVKPWHRLSDLAETIVRRYVFQKKDTTDEVEDEEPSQPAITAEAPAPCGVNPD